MNWDNPSLVVWGMGTTPGYSGMGGTEIIPAAKVAYNDIGTWDVDISTWWSEHDREASRAVVKVRGKRVQGRGRGEGKVRKCVQNNSLNYFEHLILFFAQLWIHFHSF